MAEWISVGIAGLLLVGSVVAALIKVSIAVAGNTQATNTLSAYLEKQDSRLDEHGRQLENHEGRIIGLEKTHELRGCDKAAV